MLNILYQFNEKYVPYVGVSITSLLENNKNIENITFYLLGENVTEDSQNKLVLQVEKYRRKAIYINADILINKMKQLGINEYRGSYATNIKMFIQDVIPSDIRFLLYVDADTLVMGNLSELENYDMQNNPIAMVLDSMCVKHKISIGIKENQPYFNGGVILFDMEQWRKLQCTERICKHIKNVRNHYMAPDQDIINIVLKGEITRLDIKYNIQPLHLVYDYKTYYFWWGQSCYYSKQEVENAVNKPVIIHFFRYLGQFPWHKNSLHPATQYFDKYMVKSMWNDYEKKPTEQADFIFTIERLLYRILPKALFMIIFKLSYEIFLWKSNRDSEKHMNNARM